MRSVASKAGGGGGGGVLVGGGKGERGGRRGGGSWPLGQQGRFPKTGRGRDEGEGACHSLLESLNKVGARHELRARMGQMQLGGEQEVMHIVVGMVQGMWGSASGVGCL